MLKNAQLEGRKFRRQHSVGVYILDFYCPSERLAIELDGSVHFEELSAIHDRRRDKHLNSKGIKVIRFGNSWVLKEPAFVLEAIKKEFGWRTRPDRLD
jgi:very-short-patch-repair endonuclease